MIFIIGFGAITLIDFDRVEVKNLNRILNSSKADADAGALQVGEHALPVDAGTLQHGQLHAEFAQPGGQRTSGQRGGDDLAN